MKHEYKPDAEHMISRPDWEITDAQYASWGHAIWSRWHSECPLWFVWEPDPKKPGEVRPLHFNREGLLRAHMSRLDAQGSPYRVHTVRNPPHSLQDMLERITVVDAPKQDQPKSDVVAPTHTIDASDLVVDIAKGPAPITIDDIAKVDLRIGTVVTADRVKKSDKLLVLQVDLGEAVPRQIVAGIGKTFAPEELVGKQVTVVANLPPRKMMGVESRGMILAAGESPDDLAVLSPSRAVKAGARLR